MLRNEHASAKPLFLGCDGHDRVGARAELRREDPDPGMVWLGIRGARLHGTHRHRDIAVSADENDWQMRIGFCKFCLKVEPTDAG